MLTSIWRNHDLISSSNAALVAQPHLRMGTTCTISRPSPWTHRVRVPRSGLQVAHPNGGIGDPVLLLLLTQQPRLHPITNTLGHTRSGRVGIGSSPRGPVSTTSPATMAMASVGAPSPKIERKGNWRERRGRRCAANGSRLRCCHRPPRPHDRSGSWRGLLAGAWPASGGILGVEVESPLPSHKEATRWGHAIFFCTRQVNYIITG